VKKKEEARRRIKKNQMLKDKNKNKNQSQYALTFEACNSGHKIWTNLVKGEKTMKKNSQQKKIKRLNWKQMN